MTPAGSATLCAFTHACPACKGATEAGWQRWCLLVLLVLWGRPVCLRSSPPAVHPCAAGLAGPLVMTSTRKA